MKYTVEVEIIDQGKVHLTQIWDDNPSGIARQIINITEGLKEQAIRQVLINRGWTPPKDT